MEGVCILFWNKNNALKFLCTHSSSPANSKLQIPSYRNPSNWRCGHTASFFWPYGSAVSTMWQDNTLRTNRRAIKNKSWIDLGPTMWLYIILHRDPNSPSQGLLVWVYIHTLNIQSIWARLSSWSGSIIQSIWARYSMLPVLLSLSVTLASKNASHMASVLSFSFAFFRSAQNFSTRKNKQ